MKSARPFKLLRNRSAQAWISPLVLGAFLFSVLVYCMCGPFCATAMTERADETVVVAGGCCSSHTPVQDMPSKPGCCNHGADQSQCDDDLSGDALQLSDSSVSFSIPSAEIIEIILPELSDFTVRYERTVDSAAIPITPIYIVYQSFLI